MRFAPLIAPGAQVLDVACGSGRHLRALAGRGLRLHGVDRDGDALQSLHDIAELRVADLESGPWPYGDQRFDALIVTRYLWRPLLPTLLDALAPGGLLIYETFALGQHTLGRPRHAEYLLQPGELLDRVHGRLRVIAYEDGFIEQPQPAFVQRLCAVAPVVGGPAHPKYNL
jgi:SAM-dependent methyltransferase